MVREAVAAADPYELTGEGVQEPPQGWRDSLRYFGPGLIVSASVVGSGELIATTALGAEAGFALLWMVIVSTVVKVALQIELARWTIATGEPTLTGYNRVPPKLGRIGWVNVLWTVMSLSKILQVGGIIGGTAAAFSLLRPLGPDPLEFPSLTIWTVLLAVGSIALLYSNSYRLIERGAVLLVVVFTFITIGIAIALQATPFAYSGGDIADGLRFLIPAGTVGAAVAMFGITGVGADEITFYGYWCLEKGYARWAGPNDGSEAWRARARGWMRVVYKDALLSWIVYTLGTLAFYLMGAAVLNPQGLAPEGNQMIVTLSRMYTDTLGDWARVLFLVGAIAVLGSTLWAAIPSWSRMYVNLLATLGVLRWRDTAARLRWIRGFTIGLPVVWAIAFLVVGSPVVMVQIGGVMTGIFLLAVVAAVWWLRRADVDARLYGGTWFNLFLVISSVAIILVGVYTVLNVFGLTPG